jgi:hypothetical protein
MHGIAVRSRSPRALDLWDVIAQDLRAKTPDARFPPRL